MTNNKKIKLEDFKNDWFEGAAELQYIKAQVREELTKKGFLIDSSFEYGDNNEWVGVYARPQDKPTALDPYDEEEEKDLQDNIDSDLEAMNNENSGVDNSTTETDKIAETEAKEVQAEEKNFDQVVL